MLFAKKILLTLLLISSLLLSCSQSEETGKNNANSKYDLTNKEDLIRASQDENYIKSLGISLKKSRAVDSLLYGDVNGDGEANITDALLTARYSSGFTDEAFINPDAADVNDDGLINIIDALMISQYSIGLLTGFEADKNLFKNGHFHAADKNWHFFEQNNATGGSMQVVDGKLNISINNGGDYIYSVGVDQLNFNLEEGKTYELKFKARTTASVISTLKTVFQLQQDPWTAYSEKTFSINKNEQTYSMIFTMPKTDSQAGFNFHLGGFNHNISIIVDDISLYNVTPDNMLQNGNFSKGTTDWEIYANTPGIANSSVTGEELTVDITTATTNSWDMGITQTGLAIKNSGTYTLSFKAWADAPKTITVMLQKSTENYTNYSSWNPVILSTDKQSYTLNFTMLDITDPSAQIVFHIGGDDINIHLDDVLLYRHNPDPINMPTPLLRGINISNTFDAPNEGDWGHTYLNELGEYINEPGVLMQEKYFEEIKNAGFDHVRIPISWSTHTSLEAPYTIDPDFFERIDWAIKNTTDRGMVAIINIHHYRDFEDETLTPEERLMHKERLIAIWQQIAEHYQSIPDNQLYFEMFNEPFGFNADEWNELLNTIYSTIRTNNPERYLIIANEIIDEVNGTIPLTLPENYKNIMVTFHPYRPLEFCMQLVPWWEGEPFPAIEWHGYENEKAQIRNYLDIYLKWQGQHNDVVLWNGEFCVHYADMDSRVRWNTFIARECEKRGIAHTYWGFMNDEPRLYKTNPENPELEGWEKKEILDALIPQN